MSNNIDDLFERSKWGKPLNKDELAWVAGRLKSEEDEEEMWYALYILGRSFAKEYRSLVESYLHYANDPTVAARAFWALWHQWGDPEDHEQYRDIALQRIKGHDWDDEQDAQLSAIIAVEIYMIEQNDLEMAQAIMNVLLSTQCDIVKVASYEALREMNARSKSEGVLFDLEAELGKEELARLERKSEQSGSLRRPRPE